MCRVWPPKFANILKHSEQYSTFSGVNVLGEGEGMVRGGGVASDGGCAPYQKVMHSI